MGREEAGGRDGTCIFKVYLLKFMSSRLLARACIGMSSLTRGKLQLQPACAVGPTVQAACPASLLEPGSIFFFCSVG